MNTTINCPHCLTEIKVETDMYIDGDVCYDIIPNQDQAKENEQEGFTCLKCNKEFGIEIDPNFWGYGEPNLLVKLLFKSLNGLTSFIEYELGFSVRVEDDNKIYIITSNNKEEVFDFNSLMYFATEMYLDRCSENSQLKEKVSQYINFKENTKRYTPKLVAEELIEKIFKYEVDDVDNEYYLEIKKQFNEDKYDVYRRFERSKGKVFMIVNVKLKNSSENFW